MKEIPSDHIVNQPYGNYIQPYNQNIFEIINSRLQDDPDWHHKKILDFGCNIGHLLGYSNGLIKDYTGVDVQEKPIAIAKNMHSSGNWITYNGYHPAFNPSGTELFPSINDQYDYVICIGVFTHCDFAQIDYMIKEFKKILKPDGKIIFSIWEREHWELYSKVFLKTKFNIKLPESVFKEFKDSIYLIDREYSIVDETKLPVSKCTWVETFYDRKFMLTQLSGSKVLEGIYTKHTIYMI